MKLRASVICSALSIASFAGAAQGAALLHPKYSANLSSNKAVRQQQLLCDPQGVTAGSTTTDYNPDVSSIDTITAEPGFGITAVYVDVVNGDGVKPIDVYSGAAVGSVDIGQSGGGSSEISDDVAGLGSYTQSGEMQVFWEAVSTEQTDIAETGADENTDYLTFDYLPSSDSVNATYENFGAGPKDDVYEPDYLEGYLPSCPGMLTIYSLNPKSPYYYAAGFGSASASGPLVPVVTVNPEPASTALLAVGCLALVGRRKRQNLRV
jgi:hypothetical protein